MTELKKGARIKGSNRINLGAELVQKYDSGQSVRQLAASINRSYGFVHKLLDEAGVHFRDRGGARSRRLTVGFGGVGVS